MKLGSLPCGWQKFGVLQRVVVRFTSVTSSVEAILSYCAPEKSFSQAAPLAFFFFPNFPVKFLQGGICGVFRMEVNMLSLETVLLPGSQQVVVWSHAVNLVNGLEFVFITLSAISASNFTYLCTCVYVVVCSCVCGCVFVCLCVFRAGRRGGVCSPSPMERIRV